MTIPNTGDENFDQGNQGEADNGEQQQQQAPPGDGSGGGDIGVLRRKAKETDALKRENAMLRAGIDLESPLGSMFAKAYDGDLDTTKIREEAAKVGAWVDPSAQGEQQQQQQEQANQGDQGNEQVDTQEHQEMQERQRLQSGAPADTGPSADPQMEAVKAGQHRIQQGGTEEDGLIDGIRVLHDAAVAGDERVVFTPRPAEDSQRMD